MDRQARAGGRRHHAGGFLPRGPARADAGFCVSCVGAARWVPLTLADVASDVATSVGHDTAETVKMCDRQQPPAPQVLLLPPQMALSESIRQGQKRHLKGLRTLKTGERASHQEHALHLRPRLLPKLGPLCRTLPFPTSHALCRKICQPTPPQGRSQTP